MAIPTPVERLARLLDLEPAGERRFHGETGEGSVRLFGGLVAAQAFVAAARTVVGREPHSLHAYFLRPGAGGAPVDYGVEPTKQGRNFAARRVTAWQSGEIIFTLHASFTRPEAGISHHEPPPAAPDPEALPPYEQTRIGIRGEIRRDYSREPIELRDADPDDPDPRIAQPPRRRLWMRPRGAPPQDPTLHTALLIYASDRSFVATGARPHGAARVRRRAASLDHAVWLHRRVRFTDWMLFEMWSPAAHEGRALVLGGIYARDGTRVASVAQEGLFRTRPGPGAPGGGMLG